MISPEPPGPTVLRLLAAAGIAIWIASHLAGGLLLQAVVIAVYPRAGKWPGGWGPWIGLVFALVVLLWPR